MGCWVIVTLVSEFEFEEVAGTEEKGVNGNERQEKVSQNSLTLPMKDGLAVRVRLRTSEQKV